MKKFEIKDGIILNGPNEGDYKEAFVDDGGYISAIGFWASFRLERGLFLQGKIKDPVIYTSLLQEYSAKNIVQVLVPKQ